MGNSIVPGGMFQYGGMPVGGKVYNGMWGNTVWFVDYDNGSSGALGDGPASAQKYLNTILDKCTAWDTIYIRPRTPDLTGGDPQAMVPSTTTAKYEVPSTSYGVSIIGAGTGYDARGLGYITTLQGASGVTSAPVINVKGAYCTIENLHIKKGSVTGYPLVQFIAPGFGGVINNCKLNQGDGQTYATGSVLINAAWYTTVANCYFDRCAVGVGLSGSASGDNVGIRITGNQFLATNAAADYGDIVSVSSTGMLRCLIDDNFFGTSIPSSGAARYIKFSGGSDTGLVVNNFFATTTVVTGTIMTLNGLVDGGGNCTARGWLTS